MTVGGISDARAPLQEAEAAEMWTRAPPAIVGAVVMFTVLAFIRHSFAPIVAPLLLGAWLTYMVGIVTLLLVLLLAFRVSGLRMRVRARFWTYATWTISVTFTLGIAASVWILLPPAGEALLMMMIFLYLWFVAMVMMADGGRLSMAGSLGCLASLVVFVVTHDMPYALALVGFLVMAGVAITVIRTLIWRAADSASAARALSDRAAEQLRLALDLVSAERDAKTRFIASSSHDLQQPLQAASLYFDQAVNGANEAVRERAAAGLRSALASTQALLATMLDYLRLEAGAMPVRMDTVGLDALLSDVVLEHRAAAAASGMRLIALPTRAEAIADAQLLKRALGNLVANAIRHAAGERVLIGARRRGDSLRLWVIDDGNGIREADIPTLFDDYSQGSDHGAQGRGGFGIGLASARRMAELMGGAIGLERRWCGGSAFWIQLRVPPSATEVVLCEAA